MPEFGFDTDGSGKTYCAVNRWDDRGILGGLLLFVFGTTPHRNSICPESQQQALKITGTVLQNCIERIAQSKGYMDMPYAAAKICDAIKTANDRVRKISAFLGQGIYIGGCVLYLLEQQYIAIPFGGSTVYLWNGTEMKRKGADQTATALCRDAIGCSAEWEGTCWKGTLAEHTRLICMTGELQDTKAVMDAVREGSKEASHPNTTAMLLRRELQQRTKAPYAVMEIRG